MAEKEEVSLLEESFSEKIHLGLGPPSLLPTICSHGSQSTGGRVGKNRHHEPLCPTHFYPEAEASAVHRMGCDLTLSIMGFSIQRLSCLLVEN